MSGLAMMSDQYSGLHFNPDDERSLEKRMITADWYFDFISPYAYFASLKLEELSTRAEVRRHPVLFAALLNHWGQKGPAEVPKKREWTYRWCTWWAQQQNIPFCIPVCHPFNPVPYLRLAFAADCSRAAIDTIFASLWTTGADPTDPKVIQDLAARLNIDPASLEQQSIKDALRASTNQAIENGVFGVPSFVIDKQLFWGADSMQFVDAYLADPSLFESSEMRKIDTLPIGVVRKIPE
ncbi:2-hydroxychromene-2-carboxylate isomerase [Nevskia ramosa]|uniref:2-hydroxychromene-2-carboxylate isomerase n=1 Tax=Nevskia ramosa TaxID=64002 RepID=UPI003D09F4B8